MDSEGSYVFQLEDYRSGRLEMQHTHAGVEARGLTLEQLREAVLAELHAAR